MRSFERMNDLSISALDALIGDHDMILGDGVGAEIASWDKYPRSRSASLMASASRLRKVLLDMDSEAPVDDKVEILAIDAVVLLDLLLRRIG